MNAEKHGVRFFNAYVALNKSVDELGIKDYTIFMPGDLDTTKNYAYSKDMELNKEKLSSAMCIRYREILYGFHNA